MNEEDLKYWSEHMLEMVSIGIANELYLVSKLRIVVTIVQEKLAYVQSEILYDNGFSEIIPIGLIAEHPVYGLVIKPFPTIDDLWMLDVKFYTMLRKLHRIGRPKKRHRIKRSYMVRNYVLG